MKSRDIIILIVGVVLVVVGFVYFFKSSISNNSPQETELTMMVAKELLRDRLINGECNSDGEPESYQSCVLNITSRNSIVEIEIIYDGFYDDSVRGSRIRAGAEYVNSAWQLVGDVDTDFKCWHERGHQDFSKEFCI